jgi:hypothetical protein
MSWRFFALIPAAVALQAAPVRQLAIAGTALHQFEDGPNVAGGYAFLSGDTVFLSFQISGYQVSEKEKIQVSYQVEALDSKGLLLAPGVSRKIDAELAEEDKNWMPKARYEVLVPPLADSGAYRIRIRVKDELSGSVATAEVPFMVRGRAVEPSDTLVVRNFRFLRGEEDGQPLLLAVYRPGDAVWARFEVTGYKLAEKNSHHVEYGVSVLRPTGETLYSEPNAASEQDESFYPKRYVLGILSLKLDADIAKGEYVIVVDARDRLGDQKTESRHTFRVE